MTNGVVLDDTEVPDFDGATCDHLIADDAPVSWLLDAVGTIDLPTTE